MGFNYHFVNYTFKILFIGNVASSEISEQNCAIQIVGLYFGNRAS